MNPRIRHELVPRPPWATEALIRSAQGRSVPLIRRPSRQARELREANQVPNTVVAIHCYQGDADQVENAMPIHRSHGCPVVVLSPEDSPVTVQGATCRSAGLRGYTGQRSLDRERAHLRLLLDEWPQDYFLLNDADSMCLSAEIPAYLYEGAGAFWSNVVPEPRPHKSPYPKVAFHPPYFAHRDILEKMLSVADRVTAHPITPFIDWYLVALACESGTPFRSFPDGKSMVAWRHGKFRYRTGNQPDDFKHVQLTRGGTDGASEMESLVEQGVVMVHAVKHKDVLDRLVAAHRRYEERSRG